MPNLRSTLHKAIWGVLAALVLSAAFLAYLRPAFVVDLANRFFLCF
ncbi:MAG: hypothetical protein V4805_03740 [Pseudomonadota bacterium]